MGTPAPIRIATLDDLEVFCRFRRAMFAELGQTDPAGLDRMESAFCSYAAEAMPAGEFVAWLAEVGGEAVGSVAVVFERMPPTVRNPSGRVGYMLNLYVEPAWRRRGIARDLMKTAIADLTRRRIGLATLHASPQGRELYMTLGFVDSPEMRLFLGE